jgi:aspartate carbamoyltransferase catalytic subunit
MSVNWTKKDLLAIKDLSVEEIQIVLDTTRAYKELILRPIKKVPALRGRTVALFFVEPSTRTRISFELAAKRLSADVIPMNPSSTSQSKGESLLDTARNLEALKINTIVVRHKHAGAAEILAKNLKASIINAGDGFHEHPTQSLLDMFTILESKGSLKNLNITIVGDILHSRVARSNIWGFSKMGAHVTLCSAPTMLPKGIEKLGVKICYDLKKAIKNADVINLLRIQFERDSGTLFPSVKEYGRLYGLGVDLLKQMNPQALVMHPGPINRGIEIASAVADGPQSLILDQVTNGLAVRMAVLFLLSGEGKEQTL